MVGSLLSVVGRRKQKQACELTPTRHGQALLLRFALSAEASRLLGMLCRQLLLCGSSAPEGMTVVNIR